MDRSVYVNMYIDDNHELGKILEKTLQGANLGNFELIDFPVDQPGDSSHE